MKKIGVLSDTHNFFDHKIIDFFKGCDQIWHAGDIGNMDIITDLKSIFSEVHAVYGNIDDWVVRAQLPEVDKFYVENMYVIIKHICGRPLHYDASVRELLLSEKPNILVCGHSHILRVEYDKKYNLLFINPGAAGNSGFHKVRTALKFVIDKDKLKDLQVLELKRGRAQ